ncbi:c-type cytochrome [Peristeroidobacter soli]|jgi:mono/diheme cytochrome c family protein|uniref:c-type cytochrome n=1 Tax=Peristeroidobacter soli TaxID=2497877 RepID=UPI00101D20BC|nr:cytochrome c [Peristeroidobacter soli]
MTTSTIDGGRHARVAAVLGALGLTALAGLSLASSTKADSSVPATGDQGNSLIERGRYLARAGNCVSCHTAPGGQPFAGGLGFETPFGKLYSTNITSDPDAGIGKWTEEQFVRAVREGVRPDGAHLYPAFPYTAYTKLSDEDVAALYAFLKIVPPVSEQPPQNEMGFPFNQRWALGLWKTMFFDAGRFQPDSAQSPEWNRGAYLVESLGHCSACHSPRNFLGAEQTSKAYTGGEYTDKVVTGESRPWSAPNLTSAKNGLGPWPVEEVATYLKTGRNSFSETHGPMNEVILNSTRHLTDADTLAMARYLKSLPADEGAIGKPASEAVLSAGEALYSVHCGTCHQPNGLGAQAFDAGAKLVGNPVVQASNPASLINVILYGPHLAKLPGPKRWKDMPGHFGDKLADDEVAAIASYLRNAWGNVGGAVTEAQVARQR